MMWNLAPMKTLMITCTPTQTKLSLNTVALEASRKSPACYANTVIFLLKYLGMLLIGGVMNRYLLVCPHEVEPWFHYWYRGRVETLDAKYTLIFR